MHFPAKNLYFCGDPISVDPICPLLTVNRGQDFRRVVEGGRRITRITQRITT